MAAKGRIAHLDHYRYKRKRRRRRLKLRSWVIYAFLLLACLCVVCFISRSSLFDVKRVEVEFERNYSTVSAERIIELSGIELGENIFALSPSSINRLLSAEPVFYATEIRKKYPSTVIIKVYERQPLALVASADGVLQIDKDGVVLTIIDVIEEITLPVVTGAGRFDGNIVPGMTLEGSGVAAALALMKQFPQDAIELIEEINVEDRENIRLFTGDGLEIRIGDQSDFLAKYQVFCRVLEEERINGRINNLSCINVSVKDRPAVFYK